MIIRENFTGADVEEYAIHCGMWDAASSFLPLPSCFSTLSPISSKCYFLYCLAYQLEIESGAIASTALYATKAYVRKWNDCHGSGLLEFDNFYMEFNYSALADYTDTLEIGETVDLIYGWSDGARVPKQISKREKTAPHSYGPKTA